MAQSSSFDVAGKVTGDSVLAADAGAPVAWSNVSAGGASTIKYDTSHPAFGTLGAKVSSNGVPSTVYASWLTGDTTEGYYRSYCYFTALPGSGIAPICWLYNGATFEVAIALLPSGKLETGDNTGNVVGAVNVALNQLVRVEAHVIHSATVGLVEIKLYNSANSITADETITSTANRNTGAKSTEAKFGDAGVSMPANYDYYLDQIVASATSWVGPFPVSTTAPTVSGSAPSGSTLSCDGGTWNGGATHTLAYQWTRDGANIGGATSSTYSTQAGDVGHQIGCTVTATNAFAASETASAGSANTVTVTSSGPPANTVAPAITGTSTVGQVITTDNGTWTNSPLGYTYQWQRDTAPGAGAYSDIVSATSASHIVINADDGCHLRCVVTATNASGSGTANSNAIGPVVQPAPTNSAAPTVSGSAAVGSVLSASTGTWTRMAGYNPTFAYQWKRDGANIGGATSSTYTSQVADVSHAVSCTVTATNTGGSASQASSNAITVTQGPTNTVAPAVTGTATVGQTLTTSDGTWTGTAPVTFTHQWQRDSFGSGSYSDIAAATATTYVVVDADDACHVRCVVTGSNVDGDTAANSNAAGPVVEPAPTNTVAPLITGSTSQGAALTVTNGTWTHFAGHTTSYAYQWKRDGANIGGATSSTYSTQSADVGHVVTVTVTATNSGGSASQAASNALTIVSVPFRGYTFQ